MDGPAIGWASRWVGVPELGLEDETARRRRATGVLDDSGVLARVERWHIDTRCHVGRLGVA